MLRDQKDRRYPAPAVCPADPYNIGVVPESSWADLAALDPGERARAAGAAYKPGEGFQTPFLGGIYTLNPENRTLIPPSGRLADYQKALVLVNYLAGAQDILQNPQMIPPRSLKGGDFFFTGSHALKTQPLADAFGRNAQALPARGAPLGAAAVAAPAGDVSLWWPVLPKIALGITLYEADDEFEAEAVYTISANADRHLALDGLWALMNVATDELTA